MVMDYWRLKIPCLKTSRNIICGKFKNLIYISKHENISGDETGVTPGVYSNQKIPGKRYTLYAIVSCVQYK